MKPVTIAFTRFIKEIFKDAMLATISFLPVFLGFLFKFGVPFLDTFIARQTGNIGVLSPYYLLFDLTIIFSTPIMFGYAGLMVILEERDTGILSYLSVTPLGTKGYIVSRLVFLSAIAAVYGFVVELFFHLSDISFIQLVLGNVFSFFTGIWLICLIANLASNKVEGLAFSKFSGFLILGPFASFFIKDWLKYLTGFLPTFWFTEYCLSGGSYGFIALAVSFLLTAVYTYLTVRSTFSARRFRG